MKKIYARSWKTASKEVPAGNIDRGIMECVEACTKYFRGDKIDDMRVDSVTVTPNSGNTYVIVVLASVRREELQAEDEE